MRHAFQAIWQGLVNVNRNGYAYIWANIAFFALSLPIITLPAAWSAIWRVAHSSLTEPSVADLELFWSTFKENFLAATLWGFGLALAGFISVTNLVAYREATGWGYDLLRLGWFAALYLWLAVLLYSWGIYYEMETPSIWGASRNALVMAVTNPFFTLCILLATLTLVFISFVLPPLLPLLTIASISAIANAAVLNRLAQYRSAQGK
jgi:uncharacterized membrane protein YesL